MMASAIVAQICELIRTHGDQKLVVSVDVSTGEGDAFRRVFGEVYEAQPSTKEIVLLAEGEQNDL